MIESGTKGIASIYKIDFFFFLAYKSSGEFNERIIGIWEQLFST